MSGGLPEEVHGLPYQVKWTFANPKVLAIRPGYARTHAETRLDFLILVHTVRFLSSRYMHAGFHHQDVCLAKPEPEPESRLEQILSGESANKVDKT